MIGFLLNQLLGWAAALVTAVSGYMLALADIASWLGIINAAGARIYFPVLGIDFMIPRESFPEWTKILWAIAAVIVLLNIWEVIRFVRWHRKEREYKRMSGA